MEIAVDVGTVAHLLASFLALAGSLAHMVDAVAEMVVIADRVVGVSAAP
jgi:hypothetical protein